MSFRFFLFVSHRLERAELPAFWTQHQNCTAVPRMGKRPAPSPPGIPFWLCHCVGLWYGFPMLWPWMPHLLSAGRLAGLKRVLPRIFPSRQRVLRTALIAVFAGMLLHIPAFSQPNGSGRVALDFNEVDLSVFVRFISELTG